MGTPTMAFNSPIDAMQEFNVNLNNYAAELGRTSGGVVQMTSKSGTNEFHGSASECASNLRYHRQPETHCASPLNCMVMPLRGMWA